ncbi:MAG TPA: protein-disulfide reductase DsbD domain-containing protein [Terriglobia bacterium]|nr:protein-disulfide reductase DsbD domain-containing protein [Terriglobia bacterium]
MLKLAVGVMFLVTQLSGPGGSLPQILQPDYKTTSPVRAGQSGEITVSFGLLKGYAINFDPPITLKLTSVPGVTLRKIDFETPKKDPKSKDEYYVDLPAITVPVAAAKAGSYEIPGKLTYFFCSKSDGFCSRQVLDLKIPITVQ